MTLVDDLRRLLPENGRVADGESVLEAHAGDLTYHVPHRPDVVVFPESTAEVAAILRYSSAEGVPVVPYGTGTSLEGHVIPVHGGITLDLSRLARILAIRPEELNATVQPGVTREVLNRTAGEHDLEREHVRAHAAVADRGRAARVRRRHAPE